jgi:chromatin assembly factor 1 subunit A
MRLNAFFAKPAASTTKLASSVPSSPQKVSTQEIAKPASPEKTREPSQSDYRKEFPAFFLQSNTQISPPHQFQRDSEALHHICEKLDGFLKQPATLPAYRGSELFDMIPYQRRHGRNVKSVKAILNSAQNESNQIDLAAPTTTTTFLRDQLKKVTMKSFRFGEDVRPPYYGTFTKPLSHNQAHKICRTPYARIIPGLNYDYDSEAEWEEPEEGEDLDSEGEEDVSEDGDDDMDGFLDDEEEEIDGRRRLIVGDLEPVSTGIKWHEEGKVDPDMEVYRIEALSGT